MMNMLPNFRCITGATALTIAAMRTSVEAATEINYACGVSYSPCPAGCWNMDGTVQQEDGFRSCEATPAGYTSPIDSDELESCPEGFFSSSEGFTKCEECSPGSFSDEESSESCTPCPPGSFNALAASNRCEECDPQFYSSAGSDNARFLSGVLYCRDPIGVVTGLTAAPSEVASQIPSATASAQPSVLSSASPSSWPTQSPSTLAPSGSSSLTPPPSGQPVTMQESPIQSPSVDPSVGPSSEPSHEREENDDTPIPENGLEMQHSRWSRVIFHEAFVLVWMLGVFLSCYLVRSLYITWKHHRLVNAPSPPAPEDKV